MTEQEHCIVQARTNIETALDILEEIQRREEIELNLNPTISDLHGLIHYLDSRLEELDADTRLSNIESKLGRVERICVHAHKTIFKYKEALNGKQNNIQGETE